MQQSVPFWLVGRTKSRSNQIENKRLSQNRVGICRVLKVQSNWNFHSALTAPKRGWSFLQCSGPKCDEELPGFPTYCNQGIKLETLVCCNSPWLRSSLRWQCPKNPLSCALFPAAHVADQSETAMDSDRVAPKTSSSAPRKAGGGTCCQLVCPFGPIFWGREPCPAVSSEQPCTRHRTWHHPYKLRSAILQAMRSQVKKTGF